MIYPAAWPGRGSGNVAGMVEKDAAPGSVRLDAWIWSVRLAKTRSQAADACKGGHVRVNGEKVKPAQAVKIGDQVFVTYLLTVTAIPRPTSAANSGPAAAEMVTTAPEGSKPSIAKGTAASTVITVDDYDPATHMMTFTGPQGRQRQGEIMDPKMQALAASLKKGDKVAQGQVIGPLGATGRATGPNLHWGVNWYQVRLDPELVAGKMREE